MFPLISHCWEIWAESVPTEMKKHLLASITMTSMPILWNFLCWNSFFDWWLNHLVIFRLNVPFNLTLLGNMSRKCSHRNEETPPGIHHYDVHANSVELELFVFLWVRVKVCFSVFRVVDRRLNQIIYDLSSCISNERTLNIQKNETKDVFLVITAMM